MTNSFSVDYKLFWCARPNLLTISYKCTYKVAECRQIVCQANCGVFEHLHHRLNPSVYLTHRFLRGRLRPPVASCRIVMWVLASCWKVRISLNRLGCSFPTILFRRLCQPSRRLLVWSCGLVDILHVEGKHLVLFTRPYPLMRRNGLVNQVEFLGLAGALATV